MFFAKSLALAAFASTALAHFTLDYPTTRGFDEDDEDEFCGGFDDPTTPRNPFPLGSGGVIRIDSHHTLATVDILISTASNPTAFANFSTTFVKDYYQVAEGESCVNVDLSSLGLGLVNGSEVTVQVQFNGGDGDLFQCTDLVLLSDYTTPSNQTCTVDASTQANATASVSSAAASATTALTSLGSATASASSVTTGSAAAAATTSAASGAGRNVAAFGGVVGIVSVVLGAIAFA